MKLQEDRLQLDHDNERNVWRTLFVSDIFEKATIAHYWVINALDECTNFTTLLDSMLSKMDVSIPLRIFITSRETPELCRLFASLGPRREEEIKRVLDEIPRGMAPLYHCALDTMAIATSGKSLAKAILAWTTCGMRPLTLRGLECALEIDLKDKFSQARRDYQDVFLKLNILTWIYNVAESKDLGLVIRAAEDLKTYANSRTAERSPLRRDIKGARSWSVDLQRVTAKFADALIASPSAIYSRIPPFCPTDSAIHAIAAPRKKLSITGVSAFSWDDRLSCLDFGEGQTSALCYGADFLAVGLKGGRVVLYHPNSCHEYRSLSHGGAVIHLQFRERSDMLASSGLKTVHVWKFRTGQQICRLPFPRRCIGLVFCENLLMAASNQNEFHCCDLDHEAAECTKRPWRDCPDDGSLFLNRPPSALSIAIAHRMMAVAYSGKPIAIWDLEQDAYYGSCSKKLPSGEPSTHPVVALLFNPNPSIELLAVSYLDGELAILDPFADTEVEK
ncbi:nacht wd [Achaetomium macrosporum]|uniref:Nacht wd n=1 Tax=Achaetomium macrosporum TaxID=79813 RepID=A0AAN7C5B7_9PEZI|nr:nacht wd [Achaetomium macrosporum]